MNTLIKPQSAEIKTGSFAQVVGRGPIYEVECGECGSFFTTALRGGDCIASCTRCGNDNFIEKAFDRENLPKHSVLEQIGKFFPEALV